MSGDTKPPTIVPSEVLLESATRDRDVFRELFVLALAKLHDADRLLALRDAELTDLRARLRGRQASPARVA
ncbi:hypothetical protein [Luteitalea sp.]